MNIRITLHYRTAWGEQVVLRIGKNRFPMEYTFGGTHQALLTGRDLHDGASYTFELVRDGHLVRTEWRAHRFCAPSGSGDIILRERWTDRPAGSAFYSSAFTETIFRRPDGTSFRHPREKKAEEKGNVTFRIAAPEVRTGQSVAMVAGSKALGAWKKPHLMDDTCFPWWELTLDVKEAFEYKFVIVDTKTHEIQAWEQGS